jgi:UDP-2,4-diacetamido-2,4,6-trideoxy-beta-L-altropyranose hydrolase
LLLDPNYTKLGQDRWKNLIPARCHLFVGPEYALLRPIFFEYKRSNRHRNGKIRRILIAFGGVDVKNATKKALEAVAGLNRSDIVTDIVVGATNPHCEEIFETFGYIPNINIHRQTMGMAELMDKADLSIGAGGSMMWERCCMGLPALVIILAENQVSITEAVDEFGAIINLGAFEEITVWGIRQNILNLLENPDQVKLMSQRCRQLSGEKNCSGANIICNSMISDFVK